MFDNYNEKWLNKINDKMTDINANKTIKERKKEYIINIR